MLHHLFPEQKSGPGGFVQPDCLYMFSDLRLTLSLYIYIYIFYTILDVAILLPYIRSFSHHFSPHRQRFTEDRLAELVESEKNARYAQLLDLGRQVDHKNAEIVEMVRSQVRRLLQGKCQGARNR